MLDPQQILLPNKPVPRRSVVVLSVLVHVVVLVMSVVVWRASRVRVLPPKYATVQIISGAASVSFNPPNAQSAPQASPYHISRSQRRARLAEPATSADGAIGILREHAKQATAAIITSIKFHQIYGFSTIDYELPIQKSGELPAISAAGLPPRFEQYVVVEVTIDVDGRVADARVTTGMVPPTIEQTLLAAIREFKYNPATRDGTPVPFQLDIVVHVPT